MMVGYTFSVGVSTFQTDLNVPFMEYFLGSVIHCGEIQSSTAVRKLSLPIRVMTTAPSLRIPNLQESCDKQYIAAHVSANDLQRWPKPGKLQNPALGT